MRIFIIIIAISFVMPLSAWADCIPGIPCLEELTEDNPSTAAPESNLQNGKNDPKHSYSQACDSDVMNIIYNEAYLQAERQNLLAEAVIRKPDSVLAYSCFDQMASMSATVAAQIFSESGFWDGQDVSINTPTNRSGGKTVETTGEINTINIDSVRPIEINTVMPDDRMDQAISNTVLESMLNYLQGQYPHNFLGGEMPIGLSMSTAVYNGGYNCPMMNMVYHWAKCENFNNAEDGFFPFETMTEKDLRTLPASCDALPSLFTQDRIDVSNNKDRAYASFQVQDENFIDEITGDECGDPIATGITTYIDEPVFRNGEVVGRNIDTFPDAFCVNPKCYYDSGGCRAY